MFSIGILLLIFFGILMFDDLNTVVICIILMSSLFWSCISLKNIDDHKYLI